MNFHVFKLQFLLYIIVVYFKLYYQCDTFFDLTAILSLSRCWRKAPLRPGLCRLLFRPSALCAGKSWKSSTELLRTQFVCVVCSSSLCWYCRATTASSSCGCDSPHTAPANYGQKRAARAHLVAGKERIAAAAAVAVTRQLEAEEEEEEEAKGSSVMQTDW